jgi:Predicted permeases
LFKWKSNSEELRAYSAAISTLENQIADLDFYKYELSQYSSPLRQIVLESYKKFSLSIACFIFFFIGAPLGAIIRKGGIGTPVIISMLFFVIYWVVDISGAKLTKDGTIAPVIGAFVSTALLFPIGVFLTWKSTKDSALFNIDAYIIAIKKFFNRFSRYKNSNLQ